MERGSTAREMHTLRRILATALVIQLGLAGTAGWLHLAGHDHAFSPDLRVLTDVEESSTPTNTGVRHASSTTEHCGVLLAISQGSRDRIRPSVAIVAAPPVPRALVPRNLLPQRNPGQQPILALSPSLSPPPLV